MLKVLFLVKSAFSLVTIWLELLIYTNPSLSAATLVGSISIGLLELNVKSSELNRIILFLSSSAKTNNTDSESTGPNEISSIV